MRGPALPIGTSKALFGAAILSLLAPAGAWARKPVLGRTAVVAPVSGTVKVKKLGSERYRTLTERATIKLGATIDARHGKVKLITAANAKGATQTGVF